MTTLDIPSSPPRRRERLLALHRFLLLHGFYPLLLCTMLACSFLATRIYILHKLQYKFLVWNLFLAWIPFGFSLLAVALDEARTRQTWVKAIVWLAWLAMLPNAPYILTDFVHLWSIQPLTWWFDLGMMLTFALAGCFLGIVSLRIMHDLARPRLGHIGGWAFVTAVTLLSGFGVYLGRFQRWNSWDLLTRPNELANQIFGNFTTHAYSQTRPLGVTLMFGAMMLVTYIMFVSTATPTPPSARD